jgi:hypothetical protein
MHCFRSSIPRWNGTRRSAWCSAENRRSFAAIRESGAEIESPFYVLTESKGTEGKDARAIRLRTYLDPNEALEAAGLLE